MGCGNPGLAPGECAGEPELLASCYGESLSLAVQHGIKMIAFPSISTGIFGYPIEKAAGTALNAIEAFLEGHDEIEEIRFLLFDDVTYRGYEKALSVNPEVQLHSPEYEIILKNEYLKIINLL